MCACGDVRKTRAWEHPVQAGGRRRLPHAGCTRTGHWGAVGKSPGSSAGGQSVTQLPSSGSTLSSETCAESHAREAQTFDLYAKKVQKQLEYKSFGNIRPSVQVHVGNL